MRLGVRGRLFLLSLLLVTVVGGASGTFLELELRSWLQHRVELELRHAAEAARIAVEESPYRPTVERLDPLADALGGATASRITIIGPDGFLLGDTNLPPSLVHAAENHSRRPEVRAAVASGYGSSRRHSMTLGTDMLYVAVPYTRPEGNGVVRAAMSLDGVEAAVWRLRLVLIAAAVIGLALAVLMSGLTSHFVSRGFRRLAESARRLGSGARVAVPSTDELGRLAGSLNRMADDLEGSLASLAGERDRLETVLECMSDGVIALDATQTILLANPAAVSLLGLEESPVGKPLLEVARVPALHGLAVTAREQAAAREFAVHGLRDRRLVARGTPLSSVSGAVVVLHDVTEVRRLETIRQDFVANVSHELRTPVAVIRANAEVLLDGALGDAERSPELTAAILRNAERLSRLVADLLDLSRIEAGKYPLQIEPVEVRAAGERAVEAVLAAARERGTEITVRVEPALAVEADAAALDQILVNLLDNAVKYSPPHSHVAIRGRAYGEEARLEVCDDGPGIAPAYSARIFERFYRVDPGRSREQGGTGLGLAIVKHLADAMGGRTGFEPASPHGAIFWLTLPAATPGEDAG